MLNRKLKILFFVGFLILADIPSVLCVTSEPIIYVSGDGSGDFNCNATDADLQINEALQFVAENSSYTTVYLKGPFTYFINDTFLIGSNTTLEGDSSATIKLVNNANWEAYKSMIEERSVGVHDIAIQGFTIDGNRENNTNVISGQNYYNMIHLIKCQNISVCNMYLTNNHGDGLKTDSCSNIKLYNNTIYELGHDALYASGCSNVEAYNNKITCRTNSGLRLYNTNIQTMQVSTITLLLIIMLGEQELRSRSTERLQWMILRCITTQYTGLLSPESGFSDQDLILLPLQMSIFITTRSMIPELSPIPK